MKELMYEIVNQYAVWGIAAALALGLFFLWRLNRQLKKLNRNLSGITGKIQQYFNVILAEEDGEAEEAVRETSYRDVEITKEEREMLLSNTKVQSVDDEAVFNAVIQEYFS